MKKLLLTIMSLLIISTNTLSEEEEEDTGDLANTLNNPVANLLQLPLEFNTYKDMGPSNDGTQSVLNFKPVIPINLNEDWLVVSRTITGLVTEQEGMYSGYGSKHGLTDTLQQTFFVPQKPTENGYIWGLGPAVLLPTATDEYLGGDRYAAGINGVILKQSNGWTRGALSYHIWDISGSGPNDVNLTFLQPFIAYSNKTGGTIAINTESSYNWDQDDYEIPIHLLFKQVFPIKGHLFQFIVGPRYYAASYDDGADGWGFRGGITWLLPE